MLGLLFNLIGFSILKQIFFATLKKDATLKLPIAGCGCLKPPLCKKVFYP